jgi:RNA polymerase subunit RPABC4/transcription elongation factor Spt4
MLWQDIIVSVNSEKKIIKHAEISKKNTSKYYDFYFYVVAVTQHKKNKCIGCGDTASSTVSSSGRML